MDQARQTLTGTVEEIALFPKTRFSREVGDATVVPLGIKATVKLDDGRNAYVETSCGEFVHGAGGVTFQAPKDHPWPWAIPTPNDYVPVIWTGDRVTIEGHVKFERTSGRGNKYVVVNRTKVLACTKEDQAAPLTPATDTRAPLQRHAEDTLGYPSLRAPSPIREVPEHLKDQVALADSLLSEF